MLAYKHIIVRFKAKKYNVHTILYTHAHRSYYYTLFVGVHVFADSTSNIMCSFVIKLSKRCVLADYLILQIYRFAYLLFAHDIVNCLNFYIITEVAIMLLMLILPYSRLNAALC